MIIFLIILRSLTVLHSESIFRVRWFRRQFSNTIYTYSITDIRKRNFTRSSKYVRLLFSVWQIYKSSPTIPPKQTKKKKIFFPRNGSDYTWFTESIHPHLHVPYLRFLLTFPATSLSLRVVYTPFAKLVKYRFRDEWNYIPGISARTELVYLFKKIKTKTKIIIRVSNEFCDLQCAICMRNASTICIGGRG